MAVLRVERSGGVVTATMDRPEKRNALDAELFDALRALFEEVASSPDDRVVVLTGAGGAFSSGGDLRPEAPTGDDTLTTMRRFGATTLAIHDCPVPTIAAVDGVAAGAGLSLALACDLVVASDRARFALLFVRLGLGLDCGASWLLPRRVGGRRAAELALLGDWVEAEAAEAFGLANRVVPSAELADAARDWAERLAAHPAPGVATIKRSLQRAEGLTLAEALEAEAHDQAACTATPEFRARLEGRP